MIHIIIDRVAHDLYSLKRYKHKTFCLIKQRFKNRNYVNDNHLNRCNSYLLCNIF